VSEVLAYCDELVTSLNTAIAAGSSLVSKVKATTNIRQVSLPGVLVSPVPRRDNYTLTGGYLATLSVYCIAQGPGDLTDAKVLDELADIVTTVIDDVALVEPVSYVLPNQADPKPALRCEFTIDVTP
jgi:hypothetical protein